jgi:hypothetical protein
MTAPADRSGSSGRAWRLADAVLARVARGLDPARHPWAAAVLGELGQAAGGREALGWALGGLRVAALERGERRRAARRATAASRRRRRPAVLAAISGTSAVMTAMCLRPPPGSAVAGTAGQGGPAGGGPLLGWLALALLLLGVAAFAAATAIAGGRVRLAKRLLAATAVLGAVPAVWVGLLAAAALAWLQVATRAPASAPARPG